MPASAPRTLEGVRPDEDERFGPMERLSALSAGDCDQLAARVQALRAQWSERRWRGTFTLGRAAYADAANGADAQRDYHALVPAANAFLRAHFDDLLELVRARLERHLDEPTVLCAHLALPGVHVFAGPGIPVGDAGTPHFDLQHRYVGLPAPPDEDGLLSFTLPILNPSEGAGMDVWELTEADCRRAAVDRGLSRAQLIAITPMIRCPYVPGTLHVQRRMLLHRIAGVSRVHADDLRITLQGHGARLHGTWQLYW